MRIGIDAKWYFKGPAGPRTYVRNIVNWLALIDSENEYIIYLDKDDDVSAVKYSAPKFVTKTLSPSQSWLRVMLKLPVVAKRDKLDILYTHNFSPILSRSKRVVMIYDIIFKTHPQLFTLQERIFFRPVRLAAHLADKIITISDYCNHVIADSYHIREEKVATVLLGCNEEFRKIEDAEKISSIRKKYGIPERFILYVGRINVRKNLVRLLQAFSNIQDHKIKLLIVGERNWKTENLESFIEKSGIRERVVFLGYVPDEDLPAVYQMATVFAYIPTVEGFGLPPLESMSCGTPVVTSNISSMPEVVNDSALLVDPYNVGQITDALDNLLGSKDLRDELARKGIERARLFRWESAARETLRIFGQVYSVDP